VTSEVNSANLLVSRNKGKISFSDNEEGGAVLTVDNSKLSNL
jgi:hypothetical protein